MAGIVKVNPIIQSIANTTVGSEVKQTISDLKEIDADRFFQMNGSIKTLTQTLDGSTNITNKNTVNMADLAEGISVVGSQAASSQMEVNEVTAAIGTLIEVTHQSGSEMGNAFQGILMNLQQVTGEIAGEEINEDSLAKYEDACAQLGVSLSEVKYSAVS